MGKAKEEMATMVRQEIRTRAQRPLREMLGKGRKILN